MITDKRGFIASNLTHDLEDAIIHLDALTGIKQCIDDPAEAYERNINGTFVALEIARNAKKKFIFASSAAAANPTNPYAASKAACEAWCQAYRKTYGMYVSILRFGNVYGPKSMRKTSVVAQMCKDAIQKGVITVNGGKQMRDFVYVGDVVKAIYLHPDGLWGVRTGTQHKIIEIAELIADLSGAKIIVNEGVLDSSYDETPRIEMDYTDLEEGITKTWGWFVANFD